MSEIAKGLVGVIITVTFIVTMYLAFDHDMNRQEDRIRQEYERRRHSAPCPEAAP